MTNVFQQLRLANLVQDASDEEALNSLRAGDRFYVGFDPTAPSLQLGNLVPLMASVKLAQGGLQPVILFGGATGAIGDPSGRNTERQLLPEETIQENITRQEKQVKEIFAAVGVSPIFVNNFTWTHTVDVLGFLRDVGKHFTVNYMIAKEVVKTRLNGEGISYTEFSYMLLQAFDFYHLYTNEKVRLQIGGSDQWGNITAGLELIRKKAGENTACAFSIPLLTNSEGQKFGKSAGGAVWLDPEMTSPYIFHQFWLNTSDSDAIRFLKIFTLLSDEAISHLDDITKAEPHKRYAQKALADSVTTHIHGSEQCELAKKSGEVLFGGSIEGLSDVQIKGIFKDVPSAVITKSSVEEISVLELLVQAGAIPSKSEARRLISSGGVYINNSRIASDTQGAKEFLSRSVVVCRTGKKNYFLIHLQ